MKHYEAVTKHLHNYEPLVSCVRCERSHVASRGNQRQRVAAVTVKRATKGFRFPTPSSSNSSSRQQKDSRAHTPDEIKSVHSQIVQHEVPLFPFFTISGLSLTLMIIITESIDASVGAAFFTEGFPFYRSLSVFGVVSTRKFPIARENSQVFYVRVFYCAQERKILCSLPIIM